VQYPVHSEEQMLSGLARGEHGATEQVYKQHYKVINAWIQQNGGTASDAADIFQEAMVVLYEKAQQEDFRLTCKIGTYLFAVSKHIWYKKAQKLKKQPVILPEDAGLDGGSDWAYDDDLKVHEEREAHFEQLNTALDQLGEPCRSLIKAFYHQDKSMQQIAADFGYTNPDNAKTQKYKCLNRLRKIFYGSQAKW
jgi:RNA polymerase sigma factor (sigma-70 family)